MASLAQAILAAFLACRVVPGIALVQVPQNQVLQAGKEKVEEGFTVKSGFQADAPHWLDTDGNRIEAHGAGMLQSPDDGRWYWYGESFKGDTENPGVNCYSADTLAGPWKNHGRMLSSENISVKGWQGPYILERPKVIYNNKTKKYVLWAHLDHVNEPEPMEFLKQAMVGSRFHSAGAQPHVPHIQTTMGNSAPRMPMPKIHTSFQAPLCDQYFRNNTCPRTSMTSCDTQQLAATATALDKLQYHCCCETQLWRKISTSECAAHPDWQACTWTSKRSCPGQPMGEFGLARADMSVQYQCCCEHGKWDKRPSSLSLMGERFAQGDNVHARDNMGSGVHTGDGVHTGKVRATESMNSEADTSRADLYVLRRVVVATADSPAGPFKVEHTIVPDSVGSLDLNLFVDNDGSAYFIRSCDNAYTGISRLTDDYLDTTGIISTGPRVEGMALFRHTDGKLYMMTSHLTGWNPNPLILYRSDGPGLHDPQWVDLGNPTKDPTSFNTQPTFVVHYTTKKGLTYPIYMADNWVYGGKDGLADATYAWLPIHISAEGKAVIDRLESWNLEDPFVEYEQRRFLSRFHINTKK